MANGDYALPGITRLLQLSHNSVIALARWCARADSPRTASAVRYRVKSFSPGTRLLRTRGESVKKQMHPGRGAWIHLGWRHGGCGGNFCDLIREIANVRDYL